MKCPFGWMRLESIFGHPGPGAHFACLVLWFHPDVTAIHEPRSFQRRKTTLRVFGMISHATRRENRTLVGGSSNIATAGI
jgi:hypothetical protein